MFLITGAFGQIKIRNTILKTNLLNIPFVPSVQLEQQISNKSSVQLNVHRGYLVFFEEKDWLNITMDYRMYLTKKTHKKIKGLYLSPALTYYHDYSTWRKNSEDVSIGKGFNNLGIQFNLGYQKMFKKDKFIFDIGAGGNADLITLEKTHKNLKTIQPRLNVSLGLNLSSLDLHGRGY